MADSISIPWQIKQMKGLKSELLGEDVNTCERRQSLGLNKQTEKQKQN